MTRSLAGLGGILLGSALGVAVASLSAAAADVAALQATAGGPAGWIDWGPALTAAATLAVGILALLGRFALRAVERYLEGRLGIELDDSARRTLESAFENALSYGAVRTAELAERGRLKSDVRSIVLAEAAQYVLDSVPDTLARFHLDRAGIERRLAARLGLPPTAAAAADPAPGSPSGPKAVAPADH